MESNENVQSESDDGSFELVNFDDYDNNSAVSEDGSYDLLCSEVSETLVLTSEDEETDLETETKTNSEKEEVNMENLSETNADNQEEENDIDLYEETVIQYVKKSRKRNIEAMIYDNPNYNALEYPAHLSLKADIKTVAKNHIIRYFPAKTLARSRLVSRDFNTWISGPFFATMQSQYFKKTSGFFSSDDSSICFISLDKSAYGVPSPSLRFIPEAVSVISSSNGLLLCQAVCGEREYYVCNPANKQFVKLPVSAYYHGETPKTVLAFEPSCLNFTPSYQAVCPFSLPDPYAGPIVYFDIYDSDTKSWRVSDTVCVDLDESDVKTEGIFVNGVVYWETTRGRMLAFDLKHEIYSTQTVPESGALTKLHGEVCYVKARYNVSTRGCVLEVYGGGVMGLKRTMEFGTGLGNIGDAEVEFKVVANSCDDVVAVVLTWRGDVAWLYAYHVEEGKVQGPICVRGCGKMFAYVNSLVPVSCP